MDAPHPLRTATGMIAAGTTLLSLIALALNRVEVAATLFGFIPGRIGQTAWAAGALPVMLTPLSSTLISAASFIWPATSSC